MRVLGGLGAKRDLIAGGDVRGLPDAGDILHVLKRGKGTGDAVGDDGVGDRFGEARDGLERFGVIGVDVGFLDRLKGTGVGVVVDRGDVIGPFVDALELGVPRQRIRVGCGPACCGDEIDHLGAGIQNIGPRASDLSRDGEREPSGLAGACDRGCGRWCDDEIVGDAESDQTHKRDDHDDQNGFHNLCLHLFIPKKRKSVL